MSLTTSNRHSGMVMALACTRHPVHDAGELWRGEASRSKCYFLLKKPKRLETVVE